MSTKAKSKNASATSPAPGSSAKASGPAKPTAGDHADDETLARGEAVKVYLLSDRGRRAAWMIGGTVIGGLFLWKFGTVAAAGGALLVALGLYHTWFFIQSMLHEAGTVSVDAHQAVLPTGLCRPQPEPIPAAKIGAAYFLRRAVPWNRSAPVLVIEVEGRAYLYPRDWFASEADQRRIMHAVLPIIASRSGAGGAAAAASE
jgi:hypothetical protein